MYRIRSCYHGCSEAQIFPLLNSDKRQYLLNRKFESKHLVNLCHVMGFTCTYSEATRVESSAIVRGQLSQLIEKSAFMQFVWDKADLNVNTIDENNTLHEMGGIMIIALHSAVLPNISITRLRYVSADTISSHTISEVKHSIMKKKAGLSAISIADVTINKNILATAPGLL